MNLKYNLFIYSISKIYLHHNINNVIYHLYSLINLFITLILLELYNFLIHLSYIYINIYLFIYYFSLFIIISLIFIAYIFITALLQFPYCPLKKS